MTQMLRSNDKSIQLRAFRANDLEAMYRLDVTCFEPPFRFSRLAMREFAEAGNAQVAVAEITEEFAGFCILHIEQVRKRRVGYIVTLDVAEQHRRKGLATALVRTMESQALTERCDELMLHVYDRNGGAMRFYERCGFVPSLAVPAFYGRGLDAQVWVKKLRG